MRCIICKKKLKKITINMAWTGPQETFEGIVVYNPYREEMIWCCSKRCVNKLQKHPELAGKSLHVKQRERVGRIKERWREFKYGLGQADHDIRFLLRMATGQDPNRKK